MNKRIMSGLILISLYICTLLLFAGCQTAPDRTDFENQLEFVLADCLYRAQKNPIVCDKIAERYRDWHKEQSFKDKLSFCKDSKNLPAGWTEETCRYYLNQK